jgi:hypothetical protein
MELFGQTFSKENAQLRNALKTKLHTASADELLLEMVESPEAAVLVIPLLVLHGRNPNSIAQALAARPELDQLAIEHRLLISLILLVCMSNEVTKKTAWFVAGILQSRSKHWSQALTGPAFIIGGHEKYPFLVRSNLGHANEFSDWEFTTVRNSIGSTSALDQETINSRVSDIVDWITSKQQ